MIEKLQTALREAVKSVKSGAQVDIAAIETLLDETDKAVEATKGVGVFSSIDAANLSNRSTIEWSDDQKSLLSIFGEDEYFKTLRSAIDSHADQIKGSLGQMLRWHADELQRECLQTAHRAKSAGEQIEELMKPEGGD